MSPTLLLLSLFQLASANMTTIDPTASAPKYLKNVDSAWSQEHWSLQVAYRSGVEWGGMLEAEDDMAEMIDLQVASANGRSQKARFVMQSLGLEATLWRAIEPELDLGATIGHQWVLVNANSSLLGLLLSSTAATAQMRWFPLRRLVFKIGPQLGVGALWGTLSRYPIEQDADASGPGSEVAEYWLGVGNEDLDLTGFRVQAGGALEVRVLPNLGVGGSILLARDAWTMAESDPLDRTDIGYPESPIAYSLTLESHLALRF